MNAEVTQLDQLLHAPVTQETAPAAIESLRAARLAGQVNEASYLSRSDYLHEVAAGKQVEAPNPYPTVEQRLDQMVGDTMRPGEIHEYRLPTDPKGTELDDAGIERDTEVRQALVAVKAPARLGGTLVERVNEVAVRMAALSPEGRQDRVNAFQAELKQHWGDQYQANAELVTDFVARAAESSPLLGDILDNAPLLLADKWIAESLLSIAEFHKRK